MRTRELRINHYRIRVAPLPAALALGMLAVLLWAGFWQLDRAEEKRRIIAEQVYRGDKGPLVLESSLLHSAGLEQLRHRRARAVGRYRSDRQYLLDNRTHNGVAGYHVLTPFRLHDGNVQVLVNRGWVPVGRDRRQLPELAVSEQPLAEEGLIVAPPAAGISLGAAGYDQTGWPRVVQQVDLARMAEQLGEPLLPFVLQLSADSEHGYVREWQARSGLTPERHQGYAVQWFALAVALVVLCIWVALRPARENSDDR